MDQDSPQASEGMLPEAVQAMLAAAPSVEMGAPDPEAGHRVLGYLGLTDSSPLAFVASHTGGLVIDGGRLRILGCGSPLLDRALDTWNGGGDGGGARDPNGLLVGDDAIGGFYLLAGFEPGRAGGTVHYLAPDSLDYEDLGVDYGTWLAWCVGAGPAQFYEEERWDGWRSEVTGLSPDQSFRIHPPLAAEGPSVGDRERSPAPVEDVYGEWRRLRDKLGDLPEGDRFTLGSDS